MIKLIEISSINILFGALKEEDIYKQILQMESLDGWVPDIISTRWYLGENEKGEYVGIIWLSQETGNLYSFHGGIYKKYRNKSIEYLKEVLKQFKEIVNGAILMTTQPAGHKAASILVRKCGLKKAYTIKRGYSKDDMVVFLDEVE